MADVTPSTYPISVEVTVPMDVVEGRTTVPVKVGLAMFAGVYPMFETAAPEAIFPAVTLASRIFAVVTALEAILSAVMAPVAMDASPKETTHAVPLYIHVVVPTVYWSLVDGELGKSIAIMQLPNFLKM
jgi:hypothetical protein